MLAADAGCRCWLPMLAADDASPGQQVLPGDPLFDQHAHFVLGRVNRDIENQSTLGVMFTDREIGNYFNRVGGIDGRFRLNSNGNGKGQE
jgi:hypothetical protein